VSCIIYIIVFGFCQFKQTMHGLFFIPIVGMSNAKPQNQNAPLSQWLV